VLGGSPAKRRLPTISIVTPSFNQAPYLEETIQSILNQQYPNLEYIVIDGASKDGSVDIIRRYEDRIAYWISEPDSGQTAALNKGFTRATGDVVGYLNSDDLYLPGGLARVGTEFVDPHRRWLAGACSFFGEAGTYYEHRKPPRFRARWFDHCWLAQPAVFWRRSLFQQYGFFDESLHYSMDYDFWLRLVVGGERCCFLDHPIAAFRWHEDSKTIGRRSGFEPEDTLLMEKYVPMLPRRERMLARHFARLGRSKTSFAKASSLRDSRQRWKAMKVLTRAIAQYPPGIASRAFLKTAARVLS
jgi:glycosyltransferase involved in cell wall biosynthesis